MSSSRSTNHRSPSGERDRPKDDDLEETLSLALARTRSPDFTVAESVPVQEVPANGLEPNSNENEVDSSKPAWPWHVQYLIMLCSFLTSLSFGVTQVPLLYVFRLMTCDAYYEEHSSHELISFTLSQQTGLLGPVLSYVLSDGVYPSGMKIQGEPDRCSIHAIESSTAMSVSLLGASTTIFGLVNLFITGALIKRIGVKPTLLINVFFPALRLLIQNIGVEVWGTVGIIIVQSSQIVSVLGGPSGYLLGLNTFITEVVEHERRTAALGRLMGFMQLGSAIGFLVGGFVAEAFGIKIPFRLTLALFLIASAYVVIFLPHIPPAEGKATDANLRGSKKRMPCGNFFAPLAVFSPRKFIRKDGVVQTEYGSFLLACGVFLGILATGYLQTLLQLFATDVFGFGTQQNGWLIFMYFTLRGVFLTFAFPKLISLGRKLTTKTEDANRARSAEASEPSERQPLLAAQKHQANASEASADKNKVDKKEQRFTFDLTYARFSIFADGILTLLCTFVREGWQMYLVAAILPFAAGTGSASKGSVLQMVGGSASSAERTDALAGISLVEHIARLSTIFVFGMVFAGFASIGRTELTFTCNAGLALVAFGVLLMSRFPPEGSRPLDRDEPLPPAS